MSDRPGKSEEWRRRDQRVLWHPFTQHGLWAEEEFPVISAGEGVYLFDADGNKYLDGISSLWVNVHGHRRKEIDEAIHRQLEQIAHSTFLGLSHPPGIELAEKLAALAPPGLTRVFFSDNGSTAVEIALKMAYQFWCQQNPPQPQRHYFITFENAYHGDTIGAVSLGGIRLFHEVYRPLLFPTLPAPIPHCRQCPAERRERFLAGDYVPAGWKESNFPPHPPAGRSCAAGLGCLRELDRILAAERERIAGVVIEPRVQGAAGMIVQPEGFVRGVEELCRRYGVLLIADEVATGFGRTGRMFACQHEGVSPDLLTVGKGLSGGYLPLAATLAREEIFAAFWGPVHHERTFFHGHSYTANPLACAGALASLALFEQDRTLANVEARAAQAAEWLARLGQLRHVSESRQAGLMIGIELEAEPERMIPYPPEQMMGRRVCLAVRRRGVILRPLGDVIVLMPPLCIRADELDMIMRATEEAIREVTESGD